MPRVRWCPLPVLFLLICNSFWIVAVTADCWYNSEKHEEGTEVTTAEPCLNCTCSKGALLCYLRICPKLPNPPPPGCILLHRYMTCCPELICTDIPGGGNGIEARSEPEGLDVEYDSNSMKNACIANGSVYGPGSAMGSSSLCEYCYCLGGKQRCVKPKCLLPLEGCTPSYESHSCCPVHYNCTEPPNSDITTTTVSPYIEEKSGCIVSNTFYPEGGKVLGVGHSICDNCYCIRGLLRCEPLSCAPPLLGCVPVIKPGECCAASYNCSGTIEIQPEPNYGQYPIVSKQYAKLRKEVQQQSTNGATENSNIPFYVIAETQQVKNKNPTTRHFTGIFERSTKTPFYYNSMIKDNHEPPRPIHYEEKISTKSHPEIIIDYRKRPGDIVKKPTQLPGIYYATTNYESGSGNYRRPISTTGKPKDVEFTTHKTVNSITVGQETNQKKYEKLRFADYEDINKQSILSIVDALLDGRIDDIIEKKNNTETEVTTEITTETGSTETFTVTTETTTNDLSPSTNTEFTENTDSIEGITNTTTDAVEFDSTTATTITNTTDCMENVEELNETSSNALERREDFNYTHITTVLPDDINEINKLEEVKNVEDILTSTEYEDKSTETTISQEDVSINDLETKVKTATASLDAIPKILPEIEALLNITKNKETDYEYDYNEPSLPPSLPNLRIIPFVAADALDTNKADSQDNTIYPLPQERVTDPSLFSYTSLFSPPVETEGGFIPKNPPILENFYENGYHTTGVDANAVTSITNSPKTNKHNCISNGQEVRHGDTVSSVSACVICVCFYGNIVCQQPQCAPVRAGCRKANLQDHASCCPHYICDDEEAPTVVLDRIEVTPSPQELVTVAEGIVTPDPFRDVIRTEPAPDLQSLIGDIMPFFARKTSTTVPIQSTTQKQSTTETSTNKQINTTKTNDNIPQTEDEGFSLDKVLQFFFSDETKKQTTTEEIQTTPRFPEINTADHSTTTTEPSIDEKQTQPVTGTDIWQDVETRENTNDILKHPNSVDTAVPGVGLLKLAGCNIYGRMYRVGRIISELSGPCLECKCTEIGVQCKALNC